MHKSTDFNFVEEKSMCANCGAPIVEKSDWGLSFYKCDNCGIEKLFIKHEIFSKSADITDICKFFSKFNIVQYKIDGINDTYFIGCRDKYNAIDITVDKLLKFIRRIAKDKGIRLVFIINQAISEKCQDLSDDEFDKFIDDNISESTSAFMYFEDSDKNKYSLFISSSTLMPMIPVHSYNLFMELAGLEKTIWMV